MNRRLNILSIALLLLICPKLFGATISWTPSSDDDVSGYQIYYGTNSRQYTVSIDVGDVLSYEINGLTSDQTYYFSVTAYDEWGNESDASSEIEYRVTPEDTLPPTLESVELININTLQITFNEKVEIETALNIANYSISPCVVVINAVIDTSEKVVLLTTEDHLSADYLLSIHGIKDQSENCNMADAINVSYTCDIATSSVNNSTMPVEFGLMQNYPNPFNPETTIEYSIETPGHVQLIIFNVRGQIVKRLYEGYAAFAGKQNSIVWNGCDESGNVVSSGVYYYRIQQGNQSITKRMTLMR